MSGRYANRTNKEKFGLVLDALPCFNEMPVRKANLKYKYQNSDLKLIHNFIQGTKSCDISVSNKIIYMVKDSKCILEKAYLSQQEEVYDE